MKTLETSNTDKTARTSQTTNVVSIDDNSMFQIIEQNLTHFKSIASSNNNFIGKLSFVSSILRAFNLQELNIEQSFTCSVNKELDTSVIFNLLAESIYSDFPSKKNLLVEKFNNLKEEMDEGRNDFSKNAGGVTTSVWEQKSNIKELFQKILIKVKNDTDAAIALTSFFIFELQTLNSLDSQNTLAFYDLYDLNNPHDKWFAGIDISVSDSIPKKIIQ